MRHKKSNKRLGRTHEHRKAMFRNMARSLLTYERIRTTETKAKELRKVVDKLITLAIANDLHSRRQAYRVLNSHTLVQRLFDEIGPRYSGGGGGYTRIVKLAIPRSGDNAPMTVIELTRKAADETAPEKAPEKAPKKAKAKAEEKPTPKAKKAEAKPATEEASPEAPAAAEEPEEKAE